jgi:hypothetical protein
MVTCSFFEAEFENGADHIFAEERTIGRRIPENSEPPVCVARRFGGLICSEPRAKGVSRAVRLNPAPPVPRSGLKEITFKAGASQHEFQPCIEIVKLMDGLMAEFFNVGNIRPDGKRMPG